MIVSVGVICTCTHAARESFEAEYFTNVSLPCNFVLHNLTYPGLLVPFKKYWILPNTTVLADNYIGNERFHIDAPNPYTFNLLITSIDDIDFGVYHCMMLWENVFYTASFIRVALNEDGPYYKKQLEQFQRNVLIGCICAGAAVLIIVIVYLVYRCRKMQKGGTLSNFNFYSPGSNGRHDSYDNAIHRADTDKERRPPNVDEMYAHVDRTRTYATRDSAAINSSHL